MSAAIVKGLCTLPTPPKKVFLSPRNAAKAAQLAKDYNKLVTVSPSNQAVVDQSEVVFLGCLPAMTEQIATELRFAKHHTVISLVSTAPLESLKKWCSPATVVRAIPIPPVAYHAGSCVITPRHALTEAIFHALGTAVAVDTEPEFQRMMLVTCLMGQIYSQQSAVQKWLESQGIKPEDASKWVGAVYHTITFEGKAAGPGLFEELVAEQTPGGLNEQVIGVMRQGGAETALAKAMEMCLARIQGKKAPKARL